jgi:hypothetical protein
MNNFSLRFFLVVLLGVGLLYGHSAIAQDKAAEESWEVAADFEKHRPMTIAVLPMDNLSLEGGVEEALYQQVYQRLGTRGYSKVSVDHVSAVMKKLGVTVPGLLGGFSPMQLGRELHADALLLGQIEQSASVHQAVYDAVVVSCSLRLIDAKTGKVLWHAEQWRTAHRQWALDPFNMLLNTMGHANASREDRVAYLVQEMLKTLPKGAIQIDVGDLLKRAQVIKNPQ